MEQLVKDFPNIMADINRLQMEQKSLQEKISALNAEYQTLGLFAGKRKKENRQELFEAESKLHTLQQEERALNDKRCGYASEDAIAKEIEIFSHQIAERETKLQELQSVSIRSEEEILAELKAPSAGIS